MASTALSSPLLDAVQSIAPVIRERAAQADRDRRLSDQTVAAMKKAGLFRMCKPRAYGGMEVDAVTAIHIFEEVARLDMAAGWNLFLSASGVPFANWLPEKGVEDFLSGDPDDIVAGAVFPPGKAVPVDGGYRITGRWPFCSGCQHAAWFIQMATLFDGDEPRRDERGNPVQTLFLIPASDGEILDTWHTMGMRGTGSHDVAVHDLFVPTHRLGIAAPLERLPKAIDIPACRMSIWFPIAAITGPALGNARAALDAFLDLAARKTPAYGASTLAGRPAAQMQLGQAEALWRAARAQVYEAVAAAWQVVSQGRFLDPSHKISIQLATSFALQSCAQVVDLVHQAAGTSAIRLEYPFEKHFRDAHVITQHAFGSHNRFETAGKLLFGQPSDWPMTAL